MKLLELLDRSMSRAEGWLLVLLLSVMVLLAFVQVLLRNIFHEGFVWADILLRHIVLWIGFVGAALATSQERHISIDALTRFLSERARRGILALTQVFAAGVCIVLANAAVTFVQNDLEFGSTVYAEIPSWYSQIIIPVGFSAIALHFIIRAILNVRFAARKEAS
jgi:TRAP-type C4-dicarboxylate transport system permease small subunit